MKPRLNACRIRVFVLIGALATVALGVEVFGAGAFGTAFGAGAKPTEAQAAHVAGRALDAQGKPVGGAVVRLYQLDLDPRKWKEPRLTTTDQQGQYAFDKLPHGWFAITADAAGFARAFRSTQLEAGQQLAVDLGLRRPAIAAILIRDETGKPIAGARVRILRQRGANGDFPLYAIEQKSFGVEFATSDKTGRLELPPLPVGSTFNVTIDHDDFAPFKLEDVAVEPGATLTATMHRGVTLTFEFKPGTLADRVSELDIDLRHEPFSHPSTIVNHRIPVRKGKAMLTVDPGSYNFLWLKHADYLVTPWYAPDTVHGNFLRIETGKNDKLCFQLLRKVVARGRALDDRTGKPIADASVQAELNVPAPREAGKTFAGDWMHADWGTTDKEGRYTVRLASGPARVTFDERNLYTKEEHLNLVVAADGSTVIPDFRVLPMPKATGRVVGPEGRPMPQTVVRFRGKLEFVQPTLTDGQGRFELQIPWLPQEQGKRVLAHPLVAFHAYKPLGARAQVHLDRPETLSNVTLKLEPEPYERQLADVDGDFSPWEKGELTTQLRKLARPELRGKPAPEFACSSWLNAPRSMNQLTDFRGRYVLLDFWTVWCGPCHGDFPSVRLAHELYKDHGLAVIGVHDNSVPPDAVRKHVASEKLPFLVAIDTADGRTLNAYRKCGVEGYPSYLLLGPEGTIVHSDSRIPGPTLRSFKLEIIRSHLMGDSSNGKSGPKAVSQRETP